MADYSNTELGKETQYKDQYDPTLLWPIARAEAREQLSSESLGPLPAFLGADIWTAFEISWLNSDGLPQVAIAEFIFPCTSPNIIESKSFKLYLNSFNQTKFATTQAVCEVMRADLAAVSGADIDIIFYELAEYNGFKPIAEPEGHCVDQQAVAIDSYSPDASYLRVNDSRRTDETLYSHLLRTNCPVTDQPDWASVYISYQGSAIDREGLLKYLVSYRQHQDFHEQCVEKIFSDIMQRCKPEHLDVYARYMRRGGLDINPYRSTRYRLPGAHRQVRQ